MPTESTFARCVAKQAGSYQGSDDGGTATSLARNGRESSITTSPVQPQSNKQAGEESGVFVMWCSTLSSLWRDQGRKYCGSEWLAIAQSYIL